MTGGVCHQAEQQSAARRGGITALLCRFPLHGKRGGVELQRRLSNPSCMPTALPEGLCDADTHRGTCLLSLLLMVQAQMDHQQRTIAGQTCQWYAQLAPPKTGVVKEDLYRRLPAGPTHAGWKLAVQGAAPLLGGTGNFRNCPRKPCITEEDVIHSSSRHAEDGFVTGGGTRFAAFLQKPLTNFKQYGIVTFAVTKRRQA